MRGPRTRHYNISFSKSPEYFEEWSARRVLEEYGYADTSDHNKALRIRVGLAEDGPVEKLGLRFNDGRVILSSGKETLAFWNQNTLIERFHMLSKLLVVDYTINHAKPDMTISFSNPKLAFLNVGSLETMFEEYIRRGKISPEFRMYIGEDHEHCRSRGVKPGSVRDHGFGWRLKAPPGDDVYSISEIS